MEDFGAGEFKIKLGTSEEEPMIQIINATKGENLKEIRRLFDEYSSTLGFELDFQDFKEELANLPGHYATPEGRLLIATRQWRVAGCVALKNLTDDICEMKRLYVKAQFRGLGVGRALAKRIIKEARGIGYKRMRLNTVPSMEKARMLYESLGFREIPSYQYNPIEDAVFMELTLTHNLELFTYHN